MKTRPIPIIVLACCALSAAAGCNRRTVSHSDISAGNGDRDVHALVDGPAFVQPQPDRLVVTTASHEIAIEKERLLVDKKLSAKVPPDAKKFEVIVAAGTLTVSADGAEILKTPLGK
jgi:hypothetical protein